MLNKLFTTLFVLLIIIVFRNWFINPEIIGGDWPYFFKEDFLEKSILPPSWSAIHGNGLGGKILSYNIDSYLYFTQFISRTLNIPWAIVYKIFWFGVFLIFSVFSSYLLVYKITANKILAQVGSMIYTTNTYILMIVGGGQMGYAIGYALLPVAFFNFLKILDFEIKKFNINELILYSFVLAGLLVYDIRVFYIFSFLSFLYYFLRIIVSRNLDYRSTISILIIPNLIAFVLNSFWLFPLILNPINLSSSLGEIYISKSSINFFSFASLSNSLSFLHPNWPENIFGKVYFQNPMFLFIPIIAYFQLILKKNSKTYLIIALISLVGVFLSKGSGDPLGQIYIWFFNYLPGFQMFRDSTKWYILIALSYSILIPLTIKLLISKVKSGKNLTFFCSMGFLILWSVLIKESLTGSLTGTFTQNYVPIEYLQLKDILVSEKDFYRTLWVPRIYKFTLSTPNHPAIESQFIFNATDSAKIAETLKEKKTQELIERFAIKYVIIPYDSLGVMFLDDRKYSQRERDIVEKNLDGVSYINKISTGKITVYKTPIEPKLFSINRKKVSYKFINSDKYEFDGKQLNGGNLLFSQNYNKNWRLFGNEREFRPLKTYDGLIEFNIPKMNGKVEIVFIERRNYNIGWIISGASLALLVSFLVYPTISKKL